MKLFSLASALLLYPLLATAQLAVTITPPKVTGQKAIVQLKMKNNFGQNIESARAVCFLFDDQGKMVGQSPKWVIGGTKDKPELLAGGTNTFNFVITSSQPFATTNLTAKVMFNRVILAGGKIADVKDVQIVK